MRRCRKRSLLDAVLPVLDVAASGVPLVLSLGLLEPAGLNDEIVDELPRLRVLHLLLFQADLRRLQQKCGVNFAIYFDSPHWFKSENLHRIKQLLHYETLWRKVALNKGIK